MNNRSPYKVTQTVEMDSIALKNALFDAEKTFKNLSSSSLFNQVQTMLDEIKRLNDIKDKLEMSNFLLYVELERKDLVLAGYIEEIERYRMTLLKKDRDHTKELENIRDQEKEKVKRALQDELNSIESRNKAERMKLNSDIKDLQEDLFRKQRELDITTLNNKKALDEITRLKLNIQDLSNSLNDAENRRQKDLLKLKSDNQAALNDITIKANADKEIWKNNFNDEKNNELNRLRDGYDDYIADLNKKREGELQRLRYNEDQNIMKLRENDSVITGLQSALAAKNKEISDLRNQIEDANYNHNRLIEEQEQEMKKEIADCVNARDREWRDKISIEISVKDKDLKNKDNQIESLNNKSDNLVWQLGEKQKQNEDLINQVNEMNQKLDEAEKRLNEKTRIIEETYSVQITKSNQEIENLLNQLKELHLICKNNQEQNRLAVENLNNDIDLYKQENDRLKNLSEERRRQIDEWKQQYKDYVTYDEAVNLKEELSRLRKNKFHLETVHSQQQIEIVKLNERLRSYESEIDTKNQEIDVERGLNMRRGEEILYVEAENNKLRDQLREYFHNKDQYAADRMLSTESLTSLARERDQLSRQCSNYQSEIEKLNTQLATVTKKQAEQLLELENQIKNKGIPQTTTTSIRSSSIITKYGPDTRQSG